MRQTPPTKPFISPPRSVVMSRQHHSLTRGLVNGIILSLIAWIAAGYLTYILR